MVIMSALVVYVIPALLGRTYDLKNETVGPDIFQYEDVQKARIIERYMTTSEYKVVSESAEATDFLDVSGELSLKLKTGMVDIHGAGSYLKESTSFQNKVDLLIKVHYETVVLTLTSDIKPIPDWQSNLKGIEATHYVRSILYGGDLVASVRFTTTNEADKMTIKGEVQGELNSKSGSFGAGLKANLEKIKDKIGDTASMDINYYATVPLENVPRTIDGLTELVSKFPEQTKKVNDGRGVPLSMELFSLEGLEKDFTTYWQTLALADQMVVLDEQFSDIRNTKKRLADWLKTVPPVLPLEQKHRIGDFQTDLDKLDKIFSETIANLNLSIRAGGEQFKPAFEAYLGNNTEALPNMYVKRLSTLKADVLSHTPSFEADFGGAHFNYWGSDECPKDAKTIFSGLMSTTSSSSIGSSEFTCMPDNKQYPEKPSGQSDDEIEDLPQVLPVTYISRKKAQTQVEKLVKCASCRVPGKSSQTTLLGQSECPSGWTEQYRGVLVSTDYQQTKGDLVCIDSTKQFADKPSDLTGSTVITEISPKCEDFPCSGGVSDEKAIPCVVCSITRKTESLTKVLRL